VITRRRVELLPVGGSPKKPEIGPQERQTVPPAERVQTRSMTRRGPQPSPSSSSELILPVSPASRGPQPCPTTTEPSSSGPVASRGKETRCPVSVTARGNSSCPGRQKIEAPELLQPSCNRYNLRPRKKLSAIDSPKSRGDKKDHLSKSRRRVQKELPTVGG
ncbi:hypothetical protein TNCT_637711, partial [Trichonephila clavata]